MIGVADLGLIISLVGSTRAEPPVDRERIGRQGVDHIVVVGRLAVLVEVIGGAELLLRGSPSLNG